MKKTIPDPDFHLDQKVSVESVPRAISDNLKLVHSVFDKPQELMRTAEQLAASIKELGCDAIRELLRVHRLPVSGTLDVIHARLIGALAATTIPFAQALAYLHQVERWARPHFYFFKVSTRVLRILRNGSIFERTMQDAGLAEFINKPQWLSLPIRPAIETISITKTRLQVTIALTRKTSFRDPSQDEVLENGIREFKGWRFYRTVATFEIDIVSGISFLAIPCMEHGKDYQHERDSLLKILDSVIETVELEPISLAKTARAAVENPDYRKRTVALNSPVRTRVNLTSSSRKEDVFDDGFALDLREHLLSGRILGVGTYVKLQERELLCKIHEDHRLSFSTLVTEDEVREAFRTIHNTF